MRRARVRIQAAAYERNLARLTARILAADHFVDVFHVPMGWHTPLFQRFQHMSQQACRLGGLALYGAHPLVDRDVFVFEEVQPRLLIFDATDARVSEAVLSSLRAAHCPVVLRLQSIDTATTPEEVDRLVSTGSHVVYEYIDELTEHITGSVPPFVYERHRKLLKDERVFAVATSDKLYAEVRAQRSQRCLLSTNGVDPETWQFEGPAPLDLQPALRSGRPVIAYHGALARWIDPELLEAIALSGRYELVLIGFEHDKALRERGVLQLPCVHFLGSKPYAQLPAYARCYDVAILPFTRNAVTEAVSPVKLFEYMAAGKPIVTTGLPECRKYRSCLIADSPEDFLAQIDRALALRTDSGYLAILRDEARANSWTQKATELYRALGVL